MPEPVSNVSIANWKYGKHFAYSITYDEGLIETIGFAWRIHREYAIPGHINVFPHMLGKLVGDTSAGFLQSLWNLQKYAEAPQLQFLLGDGWSIGCQFSSDALEPSVDSLSRTRLEAEELLGIRIHTLAFSDFKTCQAHRAVGRQAGFRWLLACYDDLNACDEPTDIIKRSPLYHRGPAPVRFAFDPYRLLALGRDRGGWVVDVVRLVDRYPSDPARDCTPTELARRFQAVREIGADRAWAAPPEAVAAYRDLRRSTRIQAYVAGDQAISYRLSVADQMSYRGEDPAWNELTFVVCVDPGWGAPRPMLGNEAVPVQAGSQPGTWLFTHRVADGVQVRIVNDSGRPA
jgi:hypothetical protein